MAFHGMSGDDKRIVQEHCLKHCGWFTKGSLLENHLDLYGRITESGSRAYTLAAANGRS